MKKSKATNKVTAGKILSILLIEDSEVLANLFKNFIERLNARVDMAFNGQEALEKYQANQYDLIFCDCKLPDMNGADIIKKMRDYEKSPYTGKDNEKDTEKNTKKNKKPVPMMGLSADMSKEEIQEWLNIGATQVYPKESLVLRLESILYVYCRL